MMMAGTPPKPAKATSGGGARLPAPAKAPPRQAEKRAPEAALSTPQPTAPPHAKAPASGAIPAAPAAKTSRFMIAPATVLDNRSAGVLRDVYPRSYRLGSFFRRIGRTGNIAKITAVKTSEGGAEISIDMTLEPGAMTRKAATAAATGAARAPNFNAQARSRAGGLAAMGLRALERLHLVGPGFGDEAVAGMMLGPKSINQIWQNGELLRSNGKTFRTGIEGFLREMAVDAKRHGGSVQVRATAESWGPSELGGFKNPSGEPVFKRASYRFTYAGPDGKPVTTTVDIDAPPPSTWGNGKKVTPTIGVSGYGAEAFGVD